MSNYLAPTIHPKDGSVQEATWIDNHFGRHKYGVQFPDGSIYPAKDVNRPPSREGHTVTCPRCGQRVSETHCRDDNYKDCYCYITREKAER